MKGIPLIETNDAGLIARAYNLGLKAVPNFAHVFTEEELKHYEQNLPELKDLLVRGLEIPQSQKPDANLTKSKLIEDEVVPPSFKILDTDMDDWLSKTEEFTKRYLGVEIKLRERFEMPETIPWPSAISVFDPGGDFTNRRAVKLLKKLGFAVWEEVDLMQYSGSGASAGPTLHFVQNSVRPDEDTLGMSPDQLVATGKNWLDPRGYAIAFGLYHFTTQGYLDPKTFTWFPNARLSSGRVASGYCYPDYRRVEFYWYGPDYGNPHGGARLAIPCSLKP